MQHLWFPVPLLELSLSIFIFLIISNIYADVHCACTIFCPFTGGAYANHLKRPPTFMLYWDQDKPATPPIAVFLAAVPPGAHVVGEIKWRQAKRSITLCCSPSAAHSSWYESVHMYM